MSNNRIAHFAFVKRHTKSGNADLDSLAVSYLRYLRYRYMGPMRIMITCGLHKHPTYVYDHQESTAPARRIWLTIVPFYTEVTTLG
jgi:hypothetical protein